MRIFTQRLTNTIEAMRISVLRSCFTLILITVWGLAHGQPAVDQEFSDNDVAYKVTKVAPNEVMVIAKKNGYRGPVSIPAEASDAQGVKYSVTAIGEEAFAKSAGMISVAISASVKTIGNSAFAGGTALRAITLDAGNTAFKLEDGVMLTANGETLVCRPAQLAGSEYSVPSTVTSIAAGAFASCAQLTKIELPAGLKPTGEDAFTRCVMLQAIKIPPAVGTIGKSAFFGCKVLAGIEVDANNSTYKPEQGVLLSKDGSQLLCYPAKKAEKQYQLPSTTTTVAPYAFAGAEQLQEIEVGAQVKTIGEWAFMYCTALRQITLAEGVKTIGKGGFYNCITLPSITIPNSVETLGDGVMAKCTKLTSARIGTGVRTLPYKAFLKCGSLKTVELSEGIETIGGGAFYKCAKLEEISLPKTVKRIEAKAFRSCYNLKKVSIQEGVESIGKEAFASNSVLQEAVLPNSLRTLADGVFLKCYKLENIRLGNATESIGDMAFAFCKSFTWLVIPESIRSIGSGAFDNCSKLTHLYIMAAKAPELKGNLRMSDKTNIYVLKEHEQKYKIDSWWKIYEPRIFGMAISIEPKGKQTLHEGEKLQLSARVEPEGLEYGWESEKETVVTISATGEAEGKATGTTQIHARIAHCGLASSVELEVVPGAKVTGIKLAGTADKINVGDHLKLSYTITPDNATNKKVTWASSRKDIATVNEGEVVGLAAGKTTITVTTEDGKHSDSFLLTVVDKSKTEEPTPVEESAAMELAVYPNPACAAFKLQGLTQPTTLAIYTISGELVLRKRISPQQSVNIRGLRPGIYFVRANGTTTRLIKE